MPRMLDDYITNYLEYTKNSESPKSYHLWAGISTISGALERRCFMQWGHTTIYPNQYICLIGPSGRARKGEPIAIARDFLEESGCSLVSESIIREALIRRMKNSAKEYRTEKDELMFQCPVNVVAEELAVFLGEGNVKLLADLTNWYDSREVWTYETKNSGTDQIKGVCLNMLGSMAADWIPLTLPHGAIGGGFTSRLLFVVEHKKGQTIKNPNKIKIDSALRHKLLHDLEEIKQMAGAFYFNAEAEEAYEDWYEEEEEKIDAGRPALRDPRFSGYVSRRQTHVKKVAMCISAARSSARNITLQDFHRSLQLLLDVEGQMEEVFGRVGRGTYTEQTQEIIEMVKARGKMKRSDILRVMYRDLDEPAMKSIEATLLAMQVIKIGAITTEGGFGLTYEWIGD